jgi:hypothetical protein
VNAHKEIWLQPPGSSKPRCLAELLYAIPSTLGPTIAKEGSISATPLTINSTPVEVV